MCYKYICTLVWSKMTLLNVTINLVPFQQYPPLSHILPPCLWHHFLDDSIMPSCILFLFRQKSIYKSSKNTCSYLQIINMHIIHIVYMMSISLVIKELMSTVTLLTFYCIAPYSHLPYMYLSNILITIGLFDCMHRSFPDGF